MSEKEKAPGSLSSTGGLKRVCDQHTIKRYQELPENQEISTYRGILPKGTGCLGWRDALNEIKTENHPQRGLIQKIRSEPNKEKRNALKEKLNSFTFSGKFSYRKNTGIKVCTGFIIADLDHLPDVKQVMTLLKQDPYVWFAFMSPSGDGIKVAIRTHGINNDANHKIFYAAVENYFNEVYGIQIDTQCKDISRLTFTSSDPDAFINPSPEYFNVEAWAPQPKETPEPHIYRESHTSNWQGNYGRKVLESCCERIRQSLPTQQHGVRLRQARLVGGFIASGFIDKSEALPALETAVSVSGAKDMKSAMDTIRDGIEYGKMKPITIEPRYPASPTGHSGGNHAADDTWPEPLPLKITYEPEPFPLEAMPDIFRNAIDEVGDYSQAPVAMIASSALGAASIVIQGHVDVQRDEGLEGPCSLYMWIEGESGERKTTVDKKFTQEIRAYESDIRQRMEPELHQYETDLKIFKAKEAGILDAIRAAKKDKTKADILPALEIDLSCLEQPKKPMLPVFLRGDDTPEALGYSLAKEWPSVGTVSSEAGAIFGAHGMQDKSLMRNLAFLNERWDGGTSTIGRRTSDSYTIDGARLSASLMFQKEALKLFVDSSNGLARGTGFLARPLVCSPGSTQGTRFYKAPPKGWPDLGRFNGCIRSILEQPLPFNDDGRLTPRLLPLSNAAKTIWIEYYNRIEMNLATGGQWADFRDIASKSADNASRLAAILQIMDDFHAQAVHSSYMQAGCILSEWYLGEARRLWSDICTSDEQSAAQKLDAWLIRYCIDNKVDRVERSLAMSSGPWSLRSKKKLDAALDGLVDLDRIRIVLSGQKKIIVLNPATIANGKTAKTAKTKKQESSADFSGFSNFSVSGISMPENRNCDEEVFNEDEFELSAVSETPDRVVF